jgi:hypothetical protein
MPGITMTLTGTSGTFTTMTDANGYYSFSGLPCGGNYCVMPSHPPLPCPAGFNTVDVIATQRHFLGIALTGCRLTAADVNGDGVVTTVDVIAIDHCFLHLPGISHVGEYKFMPVQQCYTAISSDQIQDFTGLVLGDTAANYLYP